jgi:short-subunit dehydrogenase
MTTSQRKPLALVTGASSGIGLELARQFGQNGFDLVIAAEDPGVSTAAADLRSTGADVQPVQVDLRTPDGVRQLYATATAGGRALDAVALNAGVGQGGAFIDTDLADDQEIIDLNITSTVQLAKLVLREMVGRGEGKVLITSSIASTMPGSFQPIYNASKSFLQSFAEAVAEELKDTGVTITSLMPGPTDTNFFHRAEMDDTPVGEGKKDDPAQVAAQGFAALMDGKNKIVAGSLKTKVQGALNDVLPDKVKAKAHRAMAEPQD